MTWKTKIFIGLALATLAFLFWRHRQKIARIAGTQMSANIAQQNAIPSASFIPGVAPMQITNSVYAVGGEG
jgi:hypothetical protein